MMRFGLFNVLPVPRWQVAVGRVGRTLGSTGLNYQDIIDGYQPSSNMVLT